MNNEKEQEKQDINDLEDFLVEMSYFLQNYLDEESETWYAMDDLIEQFKEKFNVEC